MLRIRTAVTGPTPWVPVSTRDDSFQIGLGVIPSSNATGQNFTVQHAFDNQTPYQVQYSQAGSTTVTITDNTVVGGVAGHGLSVGDSSILSGSGQPSIDGTWAVASVISQTQYTVTVTLSATASGNVNVIPLRVFPHAVIVAQTARIDGNYAFPVSMIRLLVNALTTGYIDFDVNQDFAS